MCEQCNGFESIGSDACGCEQYAEHEDCYDPETCDSDNEERTDEDEDGVCDAKDLCP